MYGKDEFHESQADAVVAQVEALLAEQDEGTLAVLRRRYEKRTVTHFHPKPDALAAAAIQRDMEANQRGACERMNLLHSSAQADSLLESLFRGLLR